MTNKTNNLKSTNSERVTAVSSLPRIADDNLSETLATFLRSCEKAQVKTGIAKACKAAASVAPINNATSLKFFDRYFIAEQMYQTDGNPDGLITGYFEPTIEFSYTPTDVLTIPIYSAPDMSAGKPFFTRQQIEQPDGLVASLLKNKVLGYTRRFPAFVLSVQGSGRVRLPDGSVRRLIFSARNGQPYSSIGRMMLNSGKIKKASLDEIERYLVYHPSEADSIYWSNPAYVFYQLKDLPVNVTGPPGALNLPLGLTPFRSVAVDWGQIIPGLPVFVQGHYGKDQTISRLMVAQDRGSAITGPVRVDVFMGADEKGKDLASTTADYSAHIWRLVEKTGN